MRSWLTGCGATGRPVRWGFLQSVPIPWFLIQICSFLLHRLYQEVLTVARYDRDGMLRMKIEPYSDTPFLKLLGLLVASNSLDLKPKS